MKKALVLFLCHKYKYLSIHIYSEFIAFGTTDSKKHIEHTLVACEIWMHIAQLGLARASSLS
jgi:hypothetical protein